MTPRYIPFKTMRYCLRAYIMLAARHLRPAVLLNTRQITTGNIIMMPRG